MWGLGNTDKEVKDFSGVIKMFYNRLVIVVQLREYTKYR